VRVWVIGGSGRVGGYVLRELLEHGHTVTNFSRTPPLAADVLHFAGTLGDLAAVRAARCGQEAPEPIEGSASFVFTIMC
jgi:uncharacterized protein YbjT (DUF2867 family)